MNEIREEEMFFFFSLREKTAEQGKEERLVD